MARWAKIPKVHLDGYNLLPYLTGAEPKSPRPGFFYFSDDGDLTELRYDHWKMVFLEQRVAGTLRIWQEPFVPLRFPSSSICVPIPTSALTSPRTPTGTG